MGEHLKNVLIDWQEVVSTSSKEADSESVKNQEHAL